MKEKKLSRKVFRCREREKRRLAVLDAVALCGEKNKNKKERAVRFGDLLTISVLLLGTNYRKKAVDEARREEKRDMIGGGPGRELSSPPSDGISNLRFSNHSDHLLVSSWDTVRLFFSYLHSLPSSFFSPFQFGVLV